jgi:membrane-bound lytic murein transglycosylase A
MIKILAVLSLFLPMGMALAIYRPPIRPAAFPAATNVAAASEVVGLDEQLWGQNGDRKALLVAIDNSLRYLKKPSAIKIYNQYPVSGVSHRRTYRSLVRFRQLLTTTKSATQLREAVQREFTLYQSVGKDNKGNVEFTGYYVPVYKGSRTRTAEYKYPLYRQPAGFSNWSKPHPTRLQLEGADGLRPAKGKLAGNEIIYMKDRFEVVLVQIQGSVKFEFVDGSSTFVGFDGGTDYPYDSIGKMLFADKKINHSQTTLPGIIRYFKDHPQELNAYIPRFKRFVFMKDKGNAPPLGSINEPVTAERSIATDKSQMPPGALALVHTKLPFYENGQLQERLVSRYVLDQDAGSAIVGPGRVDYFMGVGKKAGDRAGVTGGNGQLYYLLLKK